MEEIKFGGRSSGRAGEKPRATCAISTSPPPSCHAVVDDEQRHNIAPKLDIGYNTVQVIAAEKKGRGQGN
jgi:hypothetical protein